MNVWGFISESWNRIAHWAKLFLGEYGPYVFLSMMVLAMMTVVVWWRSRQNSSRALLIGLVVYLSIMGTWYVWRLTEAGVLSTGQVQTASQATIPVEAWVWILLVGTTVVCVLPWFKDFWATWVIVIQAVLLVLAFVLDYYIASWSLDFNWATMDATDFRHFVAIVLAGGLFALWALGTYQAREAQASLDRV